MEVFSLLGGFAGLLTSIVAVLTYRSAQQIKRKAHDVDNIRVTQDVMAETIEVLRKENQGLRQRLTRLEGAHRTCQQRLERIMHQLNGMGADVDNGR